MTLAANLKKFRAARGLTQQQVYEAAGVSKSSYTGYEAGHGMPSADKALAMAKVLGVTTDELLMDESELLISDDIVRYCGDSKPYRRRSGIKHG
ncbi:hypothetical protein AM469_006062 [Pseudomonas aeruginosa]|nr:hypothetical protein AM469_006062 [Pseudomonas aeruginosa]